MPAEAQKQDVLFRTLIATAVDGIMVIDADGIVQIYNNACEGLFGYKADEVIGRNVNMLMPSPYREEHDGYIRTYRATGEKRIIGIGREVVGQRKDASTFPMYLSVGEGVLNGSPIFVGVVHDLTTRDLNAKRAQNLQNELLHVSRLSAMGQMTAAIAHELNQPLTAIMNYLGAARRVIAKTDAGESARQLIDKAVAQTSRAGQIIRQLREFVEKRETERSEQSINKVVEEAMALSLVGSADANVKVRSALDPDVPPVLIDRIQIQQVVVNLIRNAIDAMRASPKRELTVTTRAVGGSAVEVAVADTGPGLAPEVANRLFQPFVTTKDNGMGIGLTVCQSIVEAHDGRISVARNESGGVIFSFRLAGVPR
jgi:two-component system sensor kinase FixL